MLKDNYHHYWTHIWNKVSSMSMLLTHYLKSESCFMQHGGFILAYIASTYYVINLYHHFILVNLNYNYYTENDGTNVLLRMPGLVKNYSFCVLLLSWYKNNELWDFLSTLKDHAMPLPGWPNFWIYATLPNNEESFACCIVRQILTVSNTIIIVICLWLLLPK